MLSDPQIERYSRQIILPQVGGKGQEKLLRARVLVNGNGPLQTTALLYLAAAGVGAIGVITNGSSPVLSAFAPGQPETVSAALTRLNPDCAVVTYNALAAADAKQVVNEYDLVLSPPDPLHEACYAVRRPFLCARIATAGAWLFPCLGYEPDLPCLRCLPSHLLAEEADASPLAALFLGTVQATETIKLLLGLGHSSQGKLLSCQFSAWNFSEQLVAKNPSCSCCAVRTA